MEATLQAAEKTRQQVAGLPAEKQVEAVAAALKKSNRAFNGKLISTIDNGAVTGLEFQSDNVTDISPVRALAELKSLHCAGSAPNKGKLADLWPLKGMKLQALNVSGTKVSDLGVLPTLPLAKLDIAATPVAELAALTGMALKELYFADTSVRDLAPLTGMPLEVVSFERIPIRDFTPLRKLPALRSLTCDITPWRGAAVVRAIDRLEMVNGRPAAEFWKEMDARQAAFDQWIKQVASLQPAEQVLAVVDKLKELNPGFDGFVRHRIDKGAVTSLEFFSENVADISPVRALPGLKKLVCEGRAFALGKLTDLSPLEGLTLTSLDVTYTKVYDLSPLRDMPLTELACDHTQVSDLSLLQGLALTKLECRGTKVIDLSPLRRLPLRTLHCNFQVDRDTGILRSLETLTRINDRPAAEFWKEVDKLISSSPK